ncbi:MAG: Nramp family divalent metal transporter [Halieaceae bacterium]|nr:Nramp family divalent metal transporter [Halieaceae bacterium]
MKKTRFSFGPGLLVTAAFIGPGTVATASSAGANFTFALVWALLFSVAATMTLQEMSVRSAIVTGDGLAVTLRRALHTSIAGRLALIGVVAAIGVGNAAYESGNIAGAALALGGTGTASDAQWSLAIGGAAALLLFLPAYRLIEKVLVALVLAMSAVFLVCAVALAPAWSDLLAGIRPSLPAGSLTTVIALIGTTVVPYNLFLQANAARDHWGGEAQNPGALASARFDTYASVALGGVITLAILSIGAMTALARDEAFSVAAMSSQLEPVLGPAGRYLFAAGLAAAGLTSAVTAPLAAAYAVSGVLGLDDSLRGRAFRAIALGVVAIGTAFAVTGSSPLSLILFAQAANGLMLPVVAAVLLWLMNQRRFLGDAVNGWRSNALGVLVVAVTVALGAYKLLSLA